MFMKNISPWELSAPVLHVEHPSEEGTKVYTNGPGYMTKMAAMAINSKNVLKRYK